MRYTTTAACPMLWYDAAILPYDGVILAKSKSNWQINVKPWSIIPLRETCHRELEGHWKNKDWNWRYAATLPHYHLGAWTARFCVSFSCLAASFLQDNSFKYLPFVFITLGFPSKYFMWRYIIEEKTITQHLWVIDFHMSFSLNGINFQFCLQF